MSENLEQSIVEEENNTQIEETIKLEKANISQENVKTGGGGKDAEDENIDQHGLDVPLQNEDDFMVVENPPPLEKEDLQSDDPEPNNDANQSDLPPSLEIEDKHEHAFEVAVMEDGEPTGDWIPCDIISRNEEDKTATISCMDRVIEGISLNHLRRRGSAEKEPEIDYTHKVEIVSENGKHTGEWWPCIIERRIDENTVEIRCKNGLFVVDRDHVYRKDETKKDDKLLSLSKALRDCHSGKGWFKALAPITVHGTRGTNLNYIAGTKILVTAFQADIVRVEKPIKGWMNLYDESDNVTLVFIEPHDPPAPRGSWLDVGKSLFTKVTSKMQEKLERSISLPNVKFEVVNPKGIWVRKEFGPSAKRMKMLPLHEMCVVSEVKGNYARIIHPTRGWIKTKMDSQVWNIQKVDFRNQSSDEEEDGSDDGREIQPSVFSDEQLDQFMKSDNPQIVSMAETFTNFHQDNVILNKKLVLLDNKLRRVLTEYRRRRNQKYGIHVPIWEEFKTARTRRKQVQQDIRRARGENKALKKRIAESQVLWEERDEILRRLMQQQDIFVNRSVESTLNRRDHTLDRALRQRAQSIAKRRQSVNRQKQQINEYTKKLLAQIEQRRAQKRLLEEKRENAKVNIEQLLTEKRTSTIRLETIINQRDKLLASIEECRDDVRRKYGLEVPQITTPRELKREPEKRKPVNPKPMKQEVKRKPQTNSMPKQVQEDPIVQVYSNASPRPSASMLPYQLASDAGHYARDPVIDAESDSEDFGGI